MSPRTRNPGNAAALPIASGAVSSLYYDAVADFGVSTANSAAANDIAFAAAVAACEANQRGLFLPSGTYSIATAIDLRYDGAIFRGEGMNLTKIKQTTNNTPILRLGGKYCGISDMFIYYNTPQTSSNTSANAIQFTNFWMSHLFAIAIFYPGRAFYCPTDEGTNYFFSNLVENIDIYASAVGGIHLKPTSTGNTGSVFNNIHIGWDDGGATNICTEPALYLESLGGGIFNQFNIEHMRFDNAAGLGLGVVKIRDSNVVITDLYMEGVQSVIDGGAFVECLGPTGGSQVTINNWNVNNFHADDAAVFTHAYLKVNDANTQVTVNGFTDAAASTSGTYFTFLNGAQTATQVIRVLDLYGTISVDDISNMTGTAPAIPVLKQYGERMYAWKEATGNVITGTAAPVAGTWVQGDRVINTAPAAGGASEWRCTTGGTPGTWKAINVAA